MVIEPAGKVKTVCPVRVAPDVVQTIVSCELEYSKMAVPTAVSTHLAVAVLPAVKVAEASTAVTYFDGKAIVILPPIGIAVTNVNVTAMAAVVGTPGVRGLGKAEGKAPIMPPRAGVESAIDPGLNLSVEVAMLCFPAA